MTKPWHVFFTLLACATPMAALAQIVGPNGVIIGNYPNPSTPPNLVAPNAVPGGITLVPGTVVTPGVGGSITTGTVPLAGTVGSTGVGTFNPGLGMIPNTSNGALYPQAIYPQIAQPGTDQNVLPQTNPRATGSGAYGLQNVVPYGTQPSVANCPAGVTFSNGTC
jgi:hypothetical protein